MRAAHARMFQGPPAPRGSPQQLQRLRAARARATAQGHAPAAALGLTCHCARPNMATALGLTFSPPPAGLVGKEGEVVVCGWCVLFVFLSYSVPPARQGRTQARCAAPCWTAEKPKRAHARQCLFFVLLLLLLLGSKEEIGRALSWRVK